MNGSVKRRVWISTLPRRHNGNTPPAAEGKKERYAGTLEYDPSDWAWFNENSRDRTHPVKRKKPNGLGLCDMSGNVWEWCQDRYDDDYYKNSPEQDPQGPSSGEYRVLRGGSWYFNDYSCRSSCRDRNDPDVRYDIGGFRLARD